MSELEVRIIKLGSMRVASAHGYGASPESIAWNKLVAWAKPKGFLDNLENHRIFGFNNPNPSEGTPNYGYEFWITVGPEVESEGEIEIKEFAGGTYAVTRCEPETGEEIGRDWQALGTWLADSPHQGARHQWLEGHIWKDGIVEMKDDPFAEKKLVLDLYAPIVG